MPTAIPAAVVIKNALSTITHTLTSTIPHFLRIALAIYLWIHLPIILRQSLTHTISFAHTLVVNPKPKQFRQRPFTKDYSKTLSYSFSQFIIDPRKIYHTLSSAPPTNSTSISITSDFIPPDTISFYLQGCALIFLFVLIYFALSMLKWALQSEIERITENGTTIKKFFGIDELENDLVKEEEAEFKKVATVQNQHRKARVEVLSKMIIKAHKNNLLLYKTNNVASLAPKIPKTFLYSLQTNVARNITNKIALENGLDSKESQTVFKYERNRMSEYEYLAELLKSSNKSLFPSAFLERLALKRDTMSESALKEYHGLLNHLVEERIQIRNTVLFFQTMSVIVPLNSLKDTHKEYRDVIYKWDTHSEPFSHLEALNIPTDSPSYDSTKHAQAIVLSDAISYLDERSTDREKVKESLEQVAINEELTNLIQEITSGRDGTYNGEDNSWTTSRLRREQIINLFSENKIRIIDQRSKLRSETANLLIHLLKENMDKDETDQMLSHSMDNLFGENSESSSSNAEDYDFASFGDALAAMAEPPEDHEHHHDPQEEHDHDHDHDHDVHPGQRPVIPLEERRQVAEDLRELGFELPDDFMQQENNFRGHNPLNHNNDDGDHDLPPGQFQAGDFILEDEMEGDNFELDDLQDVANALGITGNIMNLFTRFLFIVALGIFVNAVLIGVPYTFGSCCFIGVGFLVIGSAELSFYWGNRLTDATLSYFYKFAASVVASKQEQYLQLSAQYWRDTQTRTLLASYLWNFLRFSYAPYPHNFFISVAYIFAGFATVVAIGFYMAYYAPRFSRTSEGRRVEINIIQNLRFIGLIIKVVIITGIELFFFPMMCGLLISWALLPLTPSWTIADTMDFILDWPFLSPFVFWALGTLYMFQFAYYVSMCREIMRPGVLYFIRDPNDPNIHPVGDIMEREVLPQLGKIGISGLIYCALILACIGGITWSFRYVLDFSFIPLTIDWSAELVSPGVYLNFCITSLAPLFAISHYFQPAAIIHKLWINIFNKACHLLRLSSFILNKPVSIEQGTVHYGGLGAWLRNAQPDYSSPKKLEDLKTIPSNAAYFVPDGCFVRAPAADNAVVQINTKLNGTKKSNAREKKTKIFVVVSKDDERLDGEVDTDRDLKNYSIVYCPPHFRWRVAGLLAVIWLFGSLIVFSVTGLPVLIGQVQLRLLYHATTEQIQKNILLCGVIGFPIAILGITVFDQYENIKAWELEARATHGHIYRNPKNLATLVFKYFALVAAYGVIIPAMLIWLFVCLFVEPIIVFASHGYLINMRFKLDIEFVLYAVYLNLFVYAFKSNRWVPVLSHNMAQVLAPRPAEGNAEGGAWSPNAWVPYKTLIPTLGRVFVLLFCYAWGIGRLAKLCMGAPLNWSSSRIAATLAEHPFVGVFASLGLFVAVFLTYTLGDELVAKFRDDEYLVGVQLENLN